MTSVVLPASPAPQVHGRASLSRPGALEQTLTLITLATLALGLPNEWFVAWDPVTPVDVGGNALPSLVFLALGGLLCTRLIGNWPVVFEAMRREVLIPFLVGVALLSVLWSPAPVQTFRRVGAFAIATFIGYYLVVRYDLSKILRMLAVVLMIGTILNYLWVFGLPQYGIAAGAEDHWTGITSNRNVLGRMCVLSTLTFSVTYRDHRAFRLLYAAFIGLQIPLVLGAGSKTSLATLILTPILLMIYQAFRARKTLYGAVAVSLGGAATLAVAVATASLDAITKALDRDVTLSGRTLLWEDLTNEALTRPFIGFGWDAYWGGWFSPSHQIWIRHNWLPPTAHNVLLDMWLALGLLGLIPLVLLMVRGTIRASRHVRYVPGVLGLWPLGYFSIVVMMSLTESGLAGRTIFWPLLVVACVHGARLSHRVLGGHLPDEPLAPSAER